MRQLAFFSALLIGLSATATARANQCGDAFDRKDYMLAAVLCRAEADIGDAEAQYTLGFMYESGKGVAESDVEAAKWYHKAATQDVTEAQFRLGQLYYTGQVVYPPNYAEAVKWIRKAAVKGHAHAQTLLGLVYEEGWAVPQDYLAAANWYRKSMEQGFEYAFSSLGWAYYYGDGVPQDYVKAYALLFIAADFGGIGTQYQLDIVTQKLNPANISKAQKLARECAERSYKGCDF